MSRFKLLSQGPLAEWVIISSSTRHFWVGCIMLLDVLVIEFELPWPQNPRFISELPQQHDLGIGIFNLKSCVHHLFSPRKKLTCHLMERDHWTISAIFQPSIFGFHSWVYIYICCFETKNMFQVIQPVTFLSPIWRSRFAFERVTEIHHPKKVTNL